MQIMMATTWPVNVSTKVLSLSLQPIRLPDQLFDGNPVSTLHENRGDERPRRDDHMPLVTSYHLEHKVMDQQRLGLVQTVYVPINQTQSHATPHLVAACDLNKMLYLSCASSVGRHSWSATQQHHHLQSAAWTSKSPASFVNGQESTM